QIPESHVKGQPLCELLHTCPCVAVICSIRPGPCLDLRCGMIINLQSSQRLRLIEIMTSAWTYMLSPCRGRAPFLFAAKLVPILRTAAFLLAAFLGLTAVSFASDLEACSKAEADRVIAVCTEAITSRTLSTLDLAVAYRYRGV